MNTYIVIDRNEYEESGCDVFPVKVSTANDAINFVKQFKVDVPDGNLVELWECAEGDITRLV